MIAYYDASGRYAWTGSSTVLVPGIPAPPPHPYAHLPMFVGEVDQATQYHDIGSNTPVHIPAKPGEYHVFDWFSKQWFDPRTLSDLKAAKWLEIKKHRDTLEATSFPYLGKDIDSDVVSVLRINTAVKAADHAQATNTAFSTEWRCADNTLLTLDGPGLQMMPVALAVYARSLHSHANTLRAQIELASTPEELNSVAW